MAYRKRVEGRGRGGAWRPQRRVSLNLERGIPPGCSWSRKRGYFSGPPVCGADPSRSQSCLGSGEGSPTLRQGLGRLGPVLGEARGG